MHLCTGNFPFMDPLATIIKTLNKMSFIIGDCLHNGLNERWARIEDARCFAATSPETVRKGA